MAELTEEQRLGVCMEYVDGETCKKIADKYGCSISTVGRIVKESKVKRSPKPPTPPVASGSTVKKFTSRARSILWRQEGGRGKKMYKEWKDRVDWLMSESGGGYNEKQAVVRASKEYPCLTKLFREYDVSDFDPNPESHAHIDHTISAAKTSYDGIVCKKVTQSYRDSLRWAIDAAGTKLRTSVLPAECPNDTAFYLFRQAIEEPKDFMQKVSQMELKVDKEDEIRQNARKDAKRSIEEISDYLEELELEEERTEEDEQKEQS